MSTDATWLPTLGDSVRRGAATSTLSIGTVAPAEALRLASVPFISKYIGWVLRVSKVVDKAWVEVRHTQTLAQLKQAQIRVISDPQVQANLKALAAEEPKWLSKLAFLVVRLRSIGIGRPVTILFDDRIANEDQRKQLRFVWVCMSRAAYDLDRLPDYRAFVSQHSSPENLFKYRDDPEIAVDVRQTFFRMDYSFVGPLALYGAKLRQEAPSDWLICAVYDQFITASMRWLDLMATAFEIHVPEQARDRVDWKTIVQSHTLSRKARAESVRAFLDGGSELRRVLQPHDPSGQGRG